MKILHYSLGFPPYRSGGMTKFCMDMLHRQRQMGHETALLWPGCMNPVGRRVHVAARGAVDGVRSFEIINPLPVSYDEGIVAIDAFTNPCDGRGYEAFLTAYRPDVIHLHTFMGLHREFLEVARRLGIHTVFTVHDFFAICPKVTMYRAGDVCRSAADCADCARCNLSALSLKKITVLQSPLYRALKDSAAVKKLRKSHRDAYLSDETDATPAADSVPSKDAAAYRRLRAYYGDMVALVDDVHYNSTVTKAVFEQHFQPQNGHVITISHADVQDNRRPKVFSDTLRLGYLGAQSGAKGYLVLKEALDRLWAEGFRFELHLYFEPVKKEPYMHPHPRYTYAQLGEVMDGMDVLLVPSVWYETFGYTALEAISHGVPVLVSDRVGAQDILTDSTGVVVEDMTPARLAAAIRALDKPTLEAMHAAILRSATVTTLVDMTDAIMRQCYGTAAIN